MRETFLKKIADLHIRRTGFMLAAIVLITLFFAAMASRLTVTMRWSDLLPANDKRTVEFNRIIDEFNTATSFTVVVQGPTTTIKRFADELAPALLQARVENGGDTVSVLSRVDYRAETGFLRDHGLMLVKEKDLADAEEIYTDPRLTSLLANINGSLEKVYVGRSESISTREKEDQAVTMLDGISTLIAALDSASSGVRPTPAAARTAVDGLLFGDPYLISYDKSTLILNAIPTFPATEIGLVMAGTEALQAVLDEQLAAYPGVRAGLTGMMPISHDEMVYSEQSLGYTSLIAFVAILILLIVTLRMWVAPVFAMGNLLIGIIWAVGITALAVGQLNIMTQMMMVILLGLGIDFSIHIISGFTERRAAGDSITAALEDTLQKSGKGVITGGLTTAFAFLTMVISSSRGMKEMGLVTGLGLLAVLCSTFLVLPAFLVLRERRRDSRRGGGTGNQDISFRFLGSAGLFLASRKWLSLSAAVLLTLLMAWQASRIGFDQNYMNIEPAGLTSITLQDTVLAKFDLSMDYALISAGSVEESRQLSGACRDLGSVAMTEDISIYLPSPGQQEKRRPCLRRIRRAMEAAPLPARFTDRDLPALTGEIERLEMNIMEMQDMAFNGGQDKVERACRTLVGTPLAGTPPNRIAALIETLNGKRRTAAAGIDAFQGAFSPLFKTSVLRMANTAPLVLADLPVSILDRYSNEDRSRFLITVFPSGSIWQDASFLHRFADDLERVSPRATGMPPVFRALIEVIGKDGQRAMMLTLGIVFLLLLADFRNIRHAIMAIIPLAAGVVWMVGLMKLTGQQFTVLNVMGLPMILGIGIDDGVHVVHRWVSEGKADIFRVFASTGKAILLTTLTTMLAFGSLIFSIWRGFGQLGAALFVGVGACFLTTVLFLAAFMGFAGNRR
ncbi:MMPL family transporter [bacterium]|nr:MMPL family transporter [bacterium]